jgi:hypothetical protein
MLGVDRDHVLVDMAVVRVVQMPVVEVVDVSLVLNRNVPAGRTVLVLVLLVNEMLGGHERDSSARIGLRRGGWGEVERGPGACPGRLKSGIRLRRSA